MDKREPWTAPTLQRLDDVAHVAELVDDGKTESAVITLYPQPGCPIVRALVVSSRPGLSVHFEAAADGTLLVRIR